MKALIRTAIVLITALALCTAPPAAEPDVRDSLHAQNIDAVRIHLNPWGAQLGFETAFAGDDWRLAALLEVIRQAEPGGGHKCSNTGAIRFSLDDGSIVGVGFLPSHTEGLFAFRLYDGERFVGAYSVDRIALLAALAGLDVPVEDPAFRD